MKNLKVNELSPIAVKSIRDFALILSWIIVIVSFGISYIKQGNMYLGCIVTLIVIFAWILFFLFDSNTHIKLAAKWGLYTYNMPNKAIIRTRNGKSEVMSRNFDFYHRKSDKITFVSKEMVNEEISIRNFYYNDRVGESIKIILSFRANTDDQSILALGKYASLKDYIVSGNNFDAIKNNVESELRMYFSKMMRENIDMNTISEIVMNNISIPNMCLSSILILKES